MNNGRDRVTRRTLLRGVGGIAIGLPLLEEMGRGTALAASVDSDIPVRAFNVFFGLGIPSSLQQEGVAGVMEPLKPLADKLLIMRGVNHLRCDKTGCNAHFDGSSAAFTGEPPNGEALAGGASIEQVIRKAHYPGGLPAGMVPTLMGGTFFRRSRISRYVHSYLDDGTVAATMQEKPRDVFDRVFGQLAIDPSQQNYSNVRMQQSVLDSVVEQYRFFTGKRSPLGAVSKSRIADHLDRIREYEQRAFGLVHKQPTGPDQPRRSKLPHGGTADPGGQGVDLSLDELSQEWRMMADIFALAIQMDRARFGSLTFLAAGERIRLKGDYFYKGEKRYQFDDARMRNSTGAHGCSHEWWHNFDPTQRNQQLRMHAHMKMQEVAYFLQLLDGPDAREVNGKSILENSLITITTESGDGRHSDPQRELSGVFHAISGAGGRFKTGETLDVNAEGLDVYNTMIGAMGGQSRPLGPDRRDKSHIDQILS